MPKLRQFQGNHLEIALLSLLEASGYHTISTPNPPMVLLGNKGLEVPDRGAFHQIDGIADFFISPPISHPHRLLAEGKFHEKDTVGIEVIRNAAGVLKDVSEYWITVPSTLPIAPVQFSAWQQAIPKSRYHYQYAVLLPYRLQHRPSRVLLHTIFIFFLLVFRTIFSQ